MKTTHNQHMKYSVLFDASLNTIKHHLQDSEWMFVDLRSDDELIDFPMIHGFKQIAFYEEIVDQSILDYKQAVFTPFALKKPKKLEALFPKDKKIVLICRRGIRAQYLKNALLHLNYSDVINVGSIHDYQ